MDTYQSNEPKTRQEKKTAVKLILHTANITPNIFGSIYIY